MRPDHLAEQALIEVSRVQRAALTQTIGRILRLLDGTTGGGNA